MEDALPCQVPNALGVLKLQQREADHVKRLEYMRRMGRHAERQDLILKAVVLKFLVEMALMPI